MPIDKAIEQYSILMKSVFSERKIFGPTAFKGTKLQQALRSMVQETLGDGGATMLENEASGVKCKTAVFAMARKNMNACLPVMFRSYRAVTNPGPNCSIWEALYATMAHPDLFKSIDIVDSSVQQSFVGGELGCSNPIAHVLSEVKKLYPDRHVACILSIGAGHARTIQVPDPGIFQRLFRTQDVVAMKQMATDSERLADEMAIRFRDTSGVYSRLNVDQRVQNVLPGSWEQLDEVSTHTGTYLRKADIHKAIEEATNSIHKRHHTIPTEHVGNSAQPTTLKRCPAPTPVYTGRHAESMQVETCITEGDNDRRVCVVSGLGGVGKTQLVLHVVERTRDKWERLIYVDASSEETIENDLADFATFEKIGKTHEDTIRWLESCSEWWLIVFDNADDPSTRIRQYIPGGRRGSIIITTRLTDLEVLAKDPDSICHLSKMSQEDGLALLIKAARLEGQTLSDNEMQAAIALLKDFDYLALAIVHAGAYMGHVRGISITKYRELFLSKRQRTLERSGELQGTIDDYGKTVCTTWNMCYELLNEHSRPILWLMAFMHYDGISENIFDIAIFNMMTNPCANTVPPTEIETEAENHVKTYLSTFLDSAGVWDNMRFAEIMADLTSCSLIDFDRMNLTYSVHILVQDWMKSVIPQSLHLALECTATLLSLPIDAFWEDEDSLAFRRKLVPHINSILRQKPNVNTIHATKFAIVYGEAGLWNQAKQLQARVLDEYNRALGSEHPATLKIMNHLAVTHAKLDRREEGLQLEIQVVGACKRVLGDEHQDTLRNMGNLALTYSDLGRKDAALNLQTRILSVQKRVLGDEHEDTLSTMNDLAVTYSDLGRWKEAEQMQVQVLGAFKRVLGGSHPNTIAAMNNLAVIYSDLGHHDEVENMHLQVVDASKRVLGEEHPDTLRNMTNLGSLYADLGRFEEAEQLQVQALNAHAEALGEEHLDTQKIMTFLATTYSLMGRWEEAEKLRVRVLDTRRRVLGEHPYTVQSMDGLALFYIQCGRWSDAERLVLEILEISERRLGSQHPNTLLTQKKLMVVRNKVAITQGQTHSLPPSGFCQCKHN